MTFSEAGSNYFQINRILITINYDQIMVLWKLVVHITLGKDTHTILISKSTCTLSNSTDEKKIKPLCLEQIVLPWFHVVGKQHDIWELLLWRKEEFAWRAMPVNQSRLIVQSYLISAKSTCLLTLMYTVHSPELLTSPHLSSIHMKSLETKQFFFTLHHSTSFVKSYCFSLLHALL